MFHDGYQIIENVFEIETCDRIIDELERFRGGRSRAGVRNLMSNEFIREVANDPRLISLTASLSGREMIPYKATLFEKTGKANWLVAFHQDTALPVERAVEENGWGPASVKHNVIFVHAPTTALSKILALRLHLDPSTKENGPLKVIPGSHLKRINAGEDQSELTKRSSVECLVGKGGIIAMSPLLLHASSKCISNEPRRVLHIEYAPSMEIEHGVWLVFA